MPSGGWGFIVGRSRRRRPARGALPESWVRRGQLQASPGARRARVCGRSVCWGSKGLRPVTSRLQFGKTAAGWNRAPGDMSTRRPTWIPPDPEPKISVLAALSKGGVSIDFSRKATRSQLRCTHSDVGRFNASHVHHPCEDPAPRGLCDAYIACASKTRQPRIRDTRLLKPTVRAVNATNATRNHGQRRPKKAVHHQ